MVTVSQFIAINGHILQEFTGTQLTSRLENPSLQEWPLCVIYKSSFESTSLEKILVKFLNGLDEGSYYKNWDYATINTRQVTLSTLGNVFQLFKFTNNLRLFKLKYIYVHK